MKHAALALALIAFSAAAYATTPAVPNPGAIITFDGNNCTEPTTTADPTRSGPLTCTTAIQGGGTMIIGYQVNSPQGAPPAGDGILSLTFSHIWTTYSTGVPYFWSGSVTFSVGDNQGGWSHFTRFVGPDNVTYGALNVGNMEGCSDQHQAFMIAPTDGTNFNVYFRLRTTNYGWWELLELIPPGQPGAGTHQHFTFYPASFTTC